MTKKEELVAYEVLLDLLENCRHNEYGFCHIVDLSDLPYFYNRNYPELFKRKPKTGYLYTTRLGTKHRYFWWKPGNIKIRTKALKSAIESLKNQIND